MYSCGPTTSSSTLVAQDSFFQNTTYIYLTEANHVGFLDNDYVEGRMANTSMFFNNTQVRFATANASFFYKSPSLEISSTMTDCVAVANGGGEDDTSFSYSYSARCLFGNANRTIFLGNNRTALSSYYGTITDSLFVGNSFQDVSYNAGRIQNVTFIDNNSSITFNGDLDTFDRVNLLAVRGCSLIHKSSNSPTLRDVPVYWGTTDTQAIEASIRDGKDGSNVGIVRVSNVSKQFYMHPIVERLLSYDFQPPPPTTSSSRTTTATTMGERGSLRNSRSGTTTTTRQASSTELELSTATAWEAWALTANENREGNLGNYTLDALVRQVAAALGDDDVAGSLPTDSPPSPIPTTTASSSPTIQGAPPSFPTTQSPSTSSPTNQGAILQPSPNPTPFPTPRPSPNPTPFPTPRQSPNPTPFPTPRPSSNPTPFPTPRPSPMPTPFPTPRPSPNPTPFPSQRPPTLNNLFNPQPTPRPTPQPTLQSTLFSTRNDGSDSSGLSTLEIIFWVVLGIILGGAATVAIMVILSNWILPWWRGRRRTRGEQRQGNDVTVLTADLGIAASLPNPEESDHLLSANNLPPPRASRHVPVFPPSHQSSQEAVPEFPATTTNTSDVPVVGGGSWQPYRHVLLESSEQAQAQTLHFWNSQRDSLRWEQEQDPPLPATPQEQTESHEPEASEDDSVETATARTELHRQVSEDEEGGLLESHDQKVPEQESDEAAKTRTGHQEQLPEEEDDEDEICLEHPAPATPLEIYDDEEVSQY